MRTSARQRWEKGVALGAALGMAIALVPCAGPGVEQAGAQTSTWAQVDGIEYEYDSDSGCLSVAGATDPDTIQNATIRGDIHGYPVTCVKDWAFDKCSELQRVTLPDTIKSIGTRAFSGCSSLSSVKLPASLASVGAGAFRDCASLNAVALPSGTQEIPDSCFESCTSLTSVQLPSSIAGIGASAFSGCSALASLAYYETDAADEADEDYDGYADDDEQAGATGTLGASAFRGCASLKALTLPNVRDIGGMAFYGMKSLEQIVLPDSVKGIAANAFANTGESVLVVCHRNTYSASFAALSGMAVRYIENISRAALSGMSARTYTGRAQGQAPSVFLGATRLVAGRDYTVAYRGNVNVGTATMTLKGVAPYYEGSLTKTFVITPKNTSVGKLKAGKKQFTASWSKQSAQASGYQVKYSLKSNMKSAKTVKVSGAQKGSTTVKKLKAKKKYYVQMRTYKTAVDEEGDSATYYSAWSKTKTVKTK